MTPDCGAVRADLRDGQRARLDDARRAALAAHLATCAACAHEDAAERALTDALAQRLPARPASVALRERLARAAVERPRSPWRRVLVPALVAAMALLVVTPLVVSERTAALREARTAAMVGEAVADHLQVIQAQRPLEIESGGVHQVRPWFEGRLDFAPVVAFAGDAEVPLRGGALAYFLDRKAAAFVYGLRRHTVTLFVFRPDGLPWPERGLERVDDTDLYRTQQRGFTVVLWRREGLGYALVSDADPGEVRQIATRFLPGA
jgi:anti-sigma factor RsiW